MPSCDTCGLLRDLDNPDHAKSYKACSWKFDVTMPEPVLHLERVALGRDWQNDPARWVTKKIIKDRPEMLPECSCWVPRRMDGELAHGE